MKKIFKSKAKRHGPKFKEERMYILHVLPKDFTSLKRQLTNCPASFEEEGKK